MTSSNPLDLRGIAKAYGGYVMGLVGANGAGKTTAIKIALGAVRHHAGAVHLIDKTRVGVVLDQPPWHTDWRVRDLSR